MIYTVTGEISKQDLGVACIHEHICVVSNDMKIAFGKEWFDKEKVISIATEIFKNADIGLFVDGTPCDLGRDIQILKEVSERSNTPIVASSGFYYYPDLFSEGRNAKQLSKWILKECREGIGLSGIKPGILKCASNEVVLSSHSKKRLQAMATVQAETGLPLYVHCRHCGEVRETVQILRQSGANLEKIIIGHCALNPTLEYLEEFLQLGCYIAMDQNHCSGRRDEVPLVLTELCLKGYASKICLSSDYCIYSDFGDDEHTGREKDVLEHLRILNYQTEKIYPNFGGSETDWKKMIGQNAIELLDI